MNFLRESEIRNYSMMIKTTDKDTVSFKSNTIYPATDYYLDFCFEKEDFYKKMRINLPKFFEGANDYIT